MAHALLRAAPALMPALAGLQAKRLILSRDGDGAVVNIGECAVALSLPETSACVIPNEVRDLLLSRAGF